MWPRVLLIQILLHNSQYGREAWRRQPDVGYLFCRWGWHGDHETSLSSFLVWQLFTIMSTSLFLMEEAERFQGQNYSWILRLQPTTSIFSNNFATHLILLLFSRQVLSDSLPATESWFQNLLQVSLGHLQAYRGHPKPLALVTGEYFGIKVSILETPSSDG